MPGVVFACSLREMGPLRHRIARTLQSSRHWEKARQRRNCQTVLTDGIFGPGSLSCYHHAFWRTALQGISHLNPSSRQVLIRELSFPSWLPSTPSPLQLPPPPRGPGSSLLGMTPALLIPLSLSAAPHCSSRSCCLAYVLKLTNTGF